MPLTDEQKQILTPLAEKLNALREQDQQIADSALKYRDNPAMFPVGFEKGLLEDAKRVKGALAQVEVEYRALWQISTFLPRVGSGRRAYAAAVPELEWA